MIMFRTLYTAMVTVRFAIKIFHTAKSTDIFKANRILTYAVVVFLISFRGQLFTPSDVSGLSISERL